MTRTRAEQILYSTEAAGSRGNYAAHIVRNTNLMPEEARRVLAACPQQYRPFDPSAFKAACRQAGVADPGTYADRDSGFVSSTGNPVIDAAGIFAARRQQVAALQGGAAAEASSAGAGAESLPPRSTAFDAIAADVYRRRGGSASSDADA